MNKQTLQTLNISTILIFDAVYLWSNVSENVVKCEGGLHGDRLLWQKEMRMWGQDECVH